MKVTATELDRLIMRIPRLTLRQLTRLFDLIVAEIARKVNGKAEKETPA